MFRAIRYKHNYGNVIVSEHGNTRSKSVCGNKIEALLRNGERGRAPFGGFIEVVGATLLQRVKLVDILGLYENEEGWGKSHLVPKHHYVIGAYFNSKYYVLLYQGQPRCFPLPPKEKVKGAEVYQLGE